MTDPSHCVNQHDDKWTIPESTVEYEKKITALEQRFDALSTKFSAMVEENAALKRERDELKEENETLRCHAYDAELAFERNAELKAENATLKKALDGLKQQLTAIGKVANFVLYKGEEAQKLAMEIENIIDPLYCPKCGACGEEGCCSPDRCIELPCLYGEHYLKSYKELEAENVILRKRLEGNGTQGGEMIQIVNVGGNPLVVSSYLLKINAQVKCEFTHDRTKGLSQCLRDAAEAYDQWIEFWEQLEKMEAK